MVLLECGWVAQGARRVVRTRHKYIHVGSTATPSDPATRMHARGVRSGKSLLFLVAAHPWSLTFLTTLLAPCLSFAFSALSNIFAPSLQNIPAPILIPRQILQPQIHIPGRD